MTGKWKEILLVVILCVTGRPFYAQETGSSLLVSSFTRELNELNSYSEKYNWMQGYYGKFSVEEGQLRISYSHPVDFSFPVDEKIVAETDDTKNVYLRCVSGNACIQNPPAGKQEINVLLLNRELKKGANKKLVELINTLLGKLKGGTYLVKKAETQLELSIVRLNEFLRNKVANVNDYGVGDIFKRVTLDQEGRLKFEYGYPGQYVVVLLDKVKVMTIAGTDKVESSLKVQAAEDGNSYCTMLHDGTFTEWIAWHMERNECIAFYTLFGNVFDAYYAEKKQYPKDYISYAEKVKKITSPDYLENITSGVIVRVEELRGKDMASKVVRKLKGKEVVVSNYLTIDETMLTYYGKVKYKDEYYGVQGLKMTFIRDKDGLDVFAYKKTSEAAARKSESKAQQEIDMRTAGIVLINKILDHSRKGTFSVFEKPSNRINRPSDNNNQFYSVTDLEKPWFIDSLILRVPLDNARPKGIEIRFKQEYLPAFLKMQEIKRSALNTASHPSVIIKSKIDRFTIHRLFVKNEAIITIMYDDTINGMEIYEYRNFDQ